jgi:hypothetical protein
MGGGWIDEADLIANPPPPPQAATEEASAVKATN